MSEVDAIADHSGVDRRRQRKSATVATPSNPDRQWEQ